jgi:hypothetical protein
LIINLRSNFEEVDVLSGALRNQRDAGLLVGNESKYGEAAVSATMPGVEPSVYIETPSPHIAKRKLPVGSMVVGLHGSLKDTDALGTMVRTPVAPLRSMVTKPDELVLPFEVAAKR